MILLQMAGMVLVLAAAGCALRAWHLDRRMQRHRVADASPLAYMLIPVRWQKRLYLPQAHLLVSSAWRTLGIMYALAIVGALLLAISGS